MSLPGSQITLLSLGIVFTTLHAALGATLEPTSIPYFLFYHLFVGESLLGAHNPTMMLSKMALGLTAGLGFVVSTNATRCRTRDSNFDLVRALASAIYYGIRLI